MSQPNDSQRDELRDRLLEQALRETLGNESPPDLSHRILAAADEQTSKYPQPKGEKVMEKSKKGSGLPSARTVTIGGVATVIGGLLFMSQTNLMDSVQTNLTDLVGSGAIHGNPTFEFAPPSESSIGHGAPMAGEDGHGGYRGPMEYGDEEFQVFGRVVDQDGSGRGPGRAGDQYLRLVENPFRAVKDHPLSTFSIDVDTASYANVRRFLLQENQLPPPDAVRIEELVNYFDYDYSGPTDDVPFASHIEVAGCPWAPEHRLVRIALKGYELDTSQRPKSNLVFLLDVSGSMSSNDKLPLLQQGMKLLAGQLTENDRVAIVVYAGSEGLVLPSTPGDQRAKVLDAIDRLKSGGSTNGGAGIELAYKTAQQHFIKDGVNRVILCTDGDFNVGTTSTGALERMVEEKAKSGVFLSVLGFGRGNLNDAMMETISNKGNGNYAYIDGITEAQKVLVEQMGGTLVTIAKDVKIQVEFNPTQVEAYRLIGYENRILAAEDFNDDKKDAGEIGAGHTVTALYELVPAGGKVELPDVDPLRYQTAPSANQNEQVSDELLTLKLRYKQPDGDTSQLLEFPTTDSGSPFAKATADFQFAAAVASFGMLLRGSAHQGISTYDAVQEIAESAKGPDKHGYRAEFIEMVKRAKPHAEQQATLIEEARKAMEAARKSAQRAKPGEGLQGVVTYAGRGPAVAISLGSEAGLSMGQHLDVYHRAEPDTHRGTLEVVELDPHSAVCKVLQEQVHAPILPGDRVVTRAAKHSLPSERSE